MIWNLQCFGGISLEQIDWWINIYRCKWFNISHIISKLKLYHDDSIISFCKIMSWLNYIHNNLSFIFVSYTFHKSLLIRSQSSYTTLRDMLLHRGIIVLMHLNCVFRIFGSRNCFCLKLLRKKEKHASLIKFLRI